MRAVPRWSQPLRQAVAVSAAAGAAIRELPGFSAGREAERDDVVALILARREAVSAFIQKGRLTAKEGSDLRSWLRSLADDIRAELHIEDGD